MKVEDDPAASVHRLADREGGLSLAHDVAEVRIGSEGRNLVQDRFAHHRPHGFRCLLEAFVKVLADLHVRYVLQAPSTKSGIAQECREFHQRQIVLREHVESVAEKFVCAGSEGIEVPSSLQYFGEFGDLDKAVT